MLEHVTVPMVALILCIAMYARVRRLIQAGSLLCEETRP